MHRRYLLGFFLLASSPFAAFAQDVLESAPDGALALVESGFAAYSNGDAAAALKTWAKGGPMEGNVKANALRGMLDFYGKPQTIDFLKQLTPSPRSQLVYCAINYEKGVAFARFQAYRNAAGAWVLTDFLFSANAFEVFPQSMLTQ